MPWERTFCRKWEGNVNGTEERTYMKETENRDRTILNHLQKILKKRTNHLKITRYPKLEKKIRAFT